ncbi:MAG: RNA polymerase sigma factor [Deinococcales bacterium]
MPPETTDEFLLYSIAASDEAALLELYRRYSAAVNSLARRILRSESDTEEVLQDVFVKVWQKALEYAPHKGKVSTWILTIAHHSAIDALRRRQSRDTQPVLEEEFVQIPDLRQVRDPLEQQILETALARLEPQERRCIELAYFEGLSHAQLSSRLEIPLGTVKTRIRTGLEKLRNTLGDW